MLGLKEGFTQEGCSLCDLKEGNGVYWKTPFGTSASIFHEECSMYGEML